MGGDPLERSWAADWIWSLLAHEKVDVTPEVKDTVWSALSECVVANRNSFAIRSRLPPSSTAPLVSEV